MTMSERRLRLSRGIAKCKLQIANCKLQLAFALAAAMILAALPAAWTDYLRSTAAALLRPGQVAASAVRRCVHQASVQAKSHFQSAAQLAAAEEELERLRQENQRLAAQLTAARARPADASGGEDTAGRLLLTGCVPARVLGRQARAFLARRQLLDVGANSGIEPDNLVIDSPALLDRGTDAQLRGGQLVLSGGRIWGKIVQAGPHTSTVRAVTESGYRDLVRVVNAEPKPDSPQRGAQGILEGTGAPLARIRLVEVTEPISVGDLVYTASGSGVLPAPLLYGRIVRLERPVGAAHWEIWVQPAVARDEPEHVAVLRTELNPLRVAGKEGPGIRD